MSDHYDELAQSYHDLNEKFDRIKRRIEDSEGCYNDPTLMHDLLSLIK